MLHTNILLERLIAIWLKCGIETSLLIKFSKFNIIKLDLTKRNCYEHDFLKVFLTESRRITDFTSQTPCIDGPSVGKLNWVDFVFIKISVELYFIKSEYTLSSWKKLFSVNTVDWEYTVNLTDFMLSKVMPLQNFMKLQITFHKNPT